MLKKCLKYDFRAVLRLWWILAVSMIGASIVAGLGIRFFTQFVIFDTTSFEGLRVLSTFTLVAAIFCILAMVMGMTVSLILTFWRMYSHFFTDEGYLTFTLPVKRSTLYLSKVIMGTLLQTATVIVLLVGVLFILLVAPPSNGLLNTAIIQDLLRLLKTLWELAGGWLFLWGALAPVILILLGLMQNGLIYLCITIGAVIAKKQKLLAAIGVYYGVSTVMGLLSEVVSLFLSGGLVALLQIATQSGITITGVTITIVLLVAALILAILSVTLHFLTLHKIETRLNLA